MQYYDRMVEQEDRRLDRYPFEFPITIDFIEKYLGRGARLIDVACGTGRYAEALRSAGYAVGASDLSDANAEATRERLARKDFGERLRFVRQANALTLLPMWEHDGTRFCCLDRATICRSARTGSRH